MRFNKFWLPAAVLNIALLSGASIAPVLAGQSDPQSSIYGTWKLYYDWYCSGNPSSTSITFKNNGTFTSSSGSGSWSFAGDSIVWKYSSSGTTYAGIEYGKTMKGRSTTYSSSYGCWTASKTSNTTSTTQVVQPLTDAGTQR